MQLQCEDCLMYEPDEDYCRWFKMRAKDCDFGCTLIARFEYYEQEEAD